MREVTKQAQRAACLARRRALSREERRSASAAICRALASLEVLQTARLILSYRSTEEEADLSAFHRWAVERGKGLAFPVSLGEGRMEAWEPKGPSSWRQGRYGIWEPDPEKSTPARPEELDAVLLPCVAFDRQGRRLGHGGGYYDRYLPLCPNAKRVLAAFACQEVETVAAAPWDQAADVAVTPEEVIWPDLTGRAGKDILT